MPLEPEEDLEQEDFDPEPGGTTHEPNHDNSEQAHDPDAKAARAKSAEVPD